MKIKLDQNLSIHLREALAALNHDVDTVFDEGLNGVDDEAVLKAASSQDGILFTLDTDFLNLKVYPPGIHSGIVVFRPPRQGH
jgi:predicted nuclease of predicted toxin-antitoxin system